MAYIKLKEELYWSLTEDKRIYVYTTNEKLKKEIVVEDTETFFNFLNFLKKFRSEEDIQNFPVLSKTEKNDILSFLKEKMYLETYDNNLTEDMLRINRFISTYPNKNYSDYISQINTTTILIIGLGTAGSYQIEFLKKIGFKNFILIDGDTVELGNIGAQNYDKNDIGKKKVDVLYQKYATSNLKIEVYRDYVYTYEELLDKVDIKKVDYLINCADDPNLCLDIIKNIYNDNHDLKMFINGYGVLEQMTVKIDSNNYKEIYEELTLHLVNEYSYRNISVNSGSIFNAFFLTFSIGKMIVDDFFSLDTSSFASVDYYLNDFYIGNRFDKYYFNEYSEKKRKLKKNINPLPYNEKKWINLENLEKNSPLYNVQLNDKKLELLLSIRDKDNWEFIKNKTDYLNNYEDITFDKIKKEFIKYVKETFSNQVFNSFLKIFKNNKLYIKNDDFLKNKSFSEKLTEENILVYSVNNKGISEHTNSIIHELFHSIYFNIGDNTYDHEHFVRKHHTQFLKKYIDDKNIRELTKAYLFETYHSYICLSLTIDYESFLIKEDLPKFFKKYPEVSTNMNELNTILKLYINEYEPLSTYKYLLPIEEDFNNLLLLEANL